MPITPHIRIDSSSYRSIHAIKQDKKFHETISAVKAHKFNQASARMQPFTVGDLQSACWLFGRVVSACMERGTRSSAHNEFILGLFNSFPPENRPELIKRAFYKLPDHKHALFLEAIGAEEQPPFHPLSNIIDERLALRAALRCCTDPAEQARLMATQDGAHLAYLIRTTNPPNQSEQDHFFSCFPSHLTKATLDFIERRIDKQCWRFNFSQMKLLFDHLPQQMEESEKKRLFNRFLRATDYPTRIHVYLTLNSMHLLNPVFHKEAEVLDQEINTEVERFVRSFRKTGHLQPFSWGSSLESRRKINNALSRIFSGFYENEILIAILRAACGDQFEICTQAYAKALKRPLFDACLPLIQNIMRSTTLKLPSFYSSTAWLLDKGLENDPLAESKKMAFFLDVPLSDWDDFIDSFKNRDLIHMALEKKAFTRVYQAIDYFIANPVTINISRKDFAELIFKFCQEHPKLVHDFIINLTPKAKTWLAQHHPEIVPFLVQDVRALS